MNTIFKMIMAIFGRMPRQRIFVHKSTLDVQSVNIDVIRWFIDAAEGVPNYREHCTVLTIKQVRPSQRIASITKIVKMIIIIIISPAGPFIDKIRWHNAPHLVDKKIGIIIIIMFKMVLVTIPVIIIIGPELRDN